MAGLVSDKTVASAIPAKQLEAFRLLQLHPGSKFTTHAAAALYGTTLPETDGLLASLVKESLISQTEPDRYLIGSADFESEAAAQTGDTHAALKRLLTWYATATVAAFKLLYPAGQFPTAILSALEVPFPFNDVNQAQSWLENNCDILISSLRIANKIGLHETAVALGRIVWLPQLDPMYPSEQSFEIIDISLESAYALGDRNEIKFHHALKAETLRSYNRLDEAEEEYQKYLVATKDDTDPGTIIIGLSIIAYIQVKRKNFAEALEIYQKIVPLFSELKETYREKRWQAVMRGHMSTLYAATEKYEQALEQAELELVLRHEAHDEIGAACALHNAANAWQGLGEHEKALTLSQQALADVRKLKLYNDVGGLILITMALSYAATGNIPAAQSALHEAIDILEPYREHAEDLATAKQKLAELEDGYPSALAGV